MPASTSKMSPFRVAACVLAVLSLAQSGAALIDDALFANRIIYKDVVIIGGGASGSHAAVRIREDFGKRVLIIEKKDRLGGHVGTYYDPATGNPFDFGVQSYLDYAGAGDFFARMGVNITAPTRFPVTTSYVDFTSGVPVPNFTPPAAADSTAAMQRYYEITRQWEPILLPGYWNFPPGNQIPEDLLLPFGEFIVKHGLENTLTRIFETTGFGTGHFLNALTFTMMGTFGPTIAGALLGQGVASFVPASKSNMELYEKIAALLGNDVLFESSVIESKRTAHGVKLLVASKSGLKLIHAKRLLVTIPPHLANMAPFDLDSVERGVFGKYEHTVTHVGLVSHPGLPVNTTLDNTPESAAPSNYFVYPEMPFLGRFDYTGWPNRYWRVITVGQAGYEIPAAQQTVHQAFQKMVDAGTLTNPTGERVRIVDWESHGATHIHVSADELRAGFIQKQYAMQGRRSTWYTGAAWTAQFTTTTWAYTNTVLPLLLRGL